MRKKILILASLALGFIATSCQDDKNVFHEIDDAITRSELAEHEITDYYWYRDNKIPIKQVLNKSFVIFKDSDKESLLNTLSKEKVRYNPSSFNTYKHGGLDLTNGDNSKSFAKGYESAELDINPSEAVKLKEVVYAAPYYIDENQESFPLATAKTL